MTKNQYEKFLKDFESIKKKFREIITEALTRNVCGNSGLLESLKKHTRKQVTYMNRISKGTNKYEPALKTMFEFLDTFYEFEENNK